MEWIISQAQSGQIDSIWGLLSLVVVAGFSAVNAYLRILDQREKRLAATKIEEVKTALVKSDENRSRSDESRSRQLEKIQKISEETKETGHKTHMLVNSVHGNALRALATLAAKYAKMTGLEEDQVFAERASQALIDHERKQSVVDKTQFDR